MATPYSMGERLKELRLQRVKTDPKWTQEYVAGEVGTTKANISKLEGKPKSRVDLGVFFALARLYGVDPEELATGRAAPGTPPDGLPPHRQALIRAYGRLPADVRRPIRALIETLDTNLNPSYMQWSAKEAERARKRDAQRHALAKTTAK